HAVPDTDFEVFIAGFLHGGQVGQCRHPLFAGDRIGLDGARLDLLGGVGGLVAHDIDLLAEQVVHGGTGALVRDGQQVDADSAGEHGAAQVAGGADAGIGQGNLVFIG